MTTEYLDVTPDWAGLRDVFTREWRRADEALLAARSRGWEAKRHAADAADAARVLLTLLGVDRAYDETGDGQ
jgi:hypothetical protein